MDPELLHYFMLRARDSPVVVADFFELYRVSGLLPFRDGCQSKTPVEDAICSDVRLAQAAEPGSCSCRMSIALLLPLMHLVLACTMRERGFDFACRGPRRLENSPCFGVPSTLPVFFSPVPRTAIQHVRSAGHVRQGEREGACLYCGACSRG